MGPFALTDHAIVPLQWGAVLGASLAAAGFDLRARRIPNVLTAILFLGGLLYAGRVAGPEGLLDAMAGCVFLALPYFALFVFASGGAGDAKLMAGIGAWVGMGGSILVLPAVAISGGVLGIAYAAKRRVLGAVLSNLGAMTFGLGMLILRRGRLEQAQDALPAGERMLRMPYALAILTGVSVAGALVVSGVRLF